MKNPIEKNTFSNKKGSLKVYAKWIKQLDLSTFEAENMVEIIPVGSKVTLEDFAGTTGPQDMYAFSISKYEVTQELYQAITRINPSYNKGENLPVESVTWYDAVYFCNELTKMTIGIRNCCYTITEIRKNNNGNIYSAKVTWNQGKKGYRLPTSAEWEMAARGGVQGGWDYKYSGSNNLTDVSWCSSNSNGKIHQVGTKKPNMAGLYDMSGNVSEWCWDTWSGSSSYRFTRGGNINFYDEHSVSSHNKSAPSNYEYYLGFRVCRGL